MSRVVHFEIHAENPARAAEFYRALFGWETVKWDGPFDYWLIKTGPDSEPGINGGIVQRRGAIDGQAILAFVCTVGVDNLDEQLKRHAELGGVVALPKMPVPGVGWLAYIKDTEQNIVGMLQKDPSATM